MGSLIDQVLISWGLKYTGEEDKGKRTGKSERAQVINLLQSEKAGKFRQEENWRQHGGRRDYQNKTGSFFNPRLLKHPRGLRVSGKDVEEVQHVRCICSKYKINKVANKFLV